MPYVGESIPLSMQLHDGATDKYVKAVVRDSAGDQISGSPIMLPHVGNGKYASSALLMPDDTGYVTATYEVYSDMALVNPSIFHTTGTDVFELVISDEIVINKLDLIIGKLESTLGSLTNVSAVIEAPKIEAAITDLKTLRAEIARGDVTGEIKSAALAAEAKTDDIEVTIGCKG